MARNSADTEATSEETSTDAEPRANTAGRGPRGKAGQDKDDQPQRGGGGGLERVTVNLIPRASRALEQAGRLTGDSKTDTINRAIQVYAYLEEVWAKGGSILARNGDDITELKFF